MTRHRTARRRGDRLVRAGTRRPASAREARRCRFRWTEIEAVTVRHYTSRAGDPHRHLHLQINARVFAEGRWRGLHTVGIRDSLDAINGIGHAAVMRSGVPGRAAAHGYTLDPDSGEVVQLAQFVGRVLRAGGADRTQHRPLRNRVACRPSGSGAGAALRRAWDARAWADARPDKVVPRPGADVDGSGGSPSWPRSATATATSRYSSRCRGRAARPRRRRDRGAHAAGRGAVGVERR